MANRSKLIGHVVAPPELVEKGDKSYCKLTLAVNRKKKDKDAEDKADFFRVTVFGNQAKSCAQYLEKGSGALVKGRIQTGRYTNKDGVEVNSLDIIARGVTFLGKSSGSDNDNVIIGRLVRAPELSYTPNTQTAVARFTLAVDRPKRKGEDAGADFIRVKVFGKSAENCERYLDKGRQVAVFGELQLDSYENKDGVTVYTHDLIADEVEFLGSGASGQPKAEKVDIPNTSDNEWGDWDEVEEDDEF